MSSGYDAIVVGGGHNGLVAAAYLAPAGLQCSSATHGGGGVTGIPGLLCTRRILKDTKRNRLRRRGGD